MVFQFNPYQHLNLSLQLKNQPKMRQKHVKNNRVNPFPNKPLFLCVCSTNLLKTLKKGKIAFNKQFFHFPLFSTLLENFLPFSSNSKLFLLFHFESLKFVIWERVTSIFPISGPSLIMQ